MHQLFLFSAADRENRAVRHDEVVSPDFPDMLYVQKDAAVAEKKPVLWEKTGGILKPEANAVAAACAGEDDIVTVGGKRKKIIERDSDRNGIRRSRGGRQKKGAFRVIRKLKAYVAVHLPPEQQKVIGKTVNVVRGEF